MSLRLGIDTGGTYTDAVLIDDQSMQVVAKSKSLTTRHNLVEGIQLAINGVLESQAPDTINLVSLSTTLATNSIVEGHGSPAALLLVGYQQSQLKLANLEDAARDLPVIFVDGGHDAGGGEKMPLDLQQVAKELARLEGSLAAVAVSAMFATRNPAHEVAVRDFVREQTGLPVSCGHTLSSSLDAPRRALTALINARLIPLIKELIDAAKGSLIAAGINAPLMVVRGDGSLVSAEFAEDSPVETILSGPAASVIGASFLAQSNHMIVSDIGGTTTDVALIHNGQPRLSRDGASVNGWRTMVQAVQIETHGLGGDSEIHYDRQNRRFQIGPQKVMPLCILASRYPSIVDDLQVYVDEPWTKTNVARFILLRRDPGATRLTAQQQALVEQVAERPQSMQSVFAERHFSLALRRLIEIGILTTAGFTPTDAAHVCGWYSHWDPSASVLGATLLSRYSKFNLGEDWTGEKAFCESILAQVSRESALCLLSSAINESNGRFGAPLHARERALLEQMFHSSAVSDKPDMLRMRAQLGIPVVGIGAPAKNFYPPIKNYLEAEIIVPEHAEVANAVGAVVGSVKQTVQLTISPLSGERVVVHAPLEQREFDALEPAAVWASDLASRMANDKAASAGGRDIKVVVDRRDNVVDQQGRKTFFECVIVATATGSV